MKIPIFVTASIVWFFENVLIVFPYFKRKKKEIDEALILLELEEKEIREKKAKLSKYCHKAILERMSGSTRVRKAREKREMRKAKQRTQCRVSGHKHMGEVIDSLFHNGWVKTVRPKFFGIKNKNWRVVQQEGIIYETDLN